MESIYTEIWMKAKPYYERGRPMDIEHIKWMMGAAERVAEEADIDTSLLIPLVILHDVGYAETGPVYFDKNKKKDHMIAGARIAREILEELDYPQKKIERIEYYISVHDNWIWGKTDVYADPVLGTFSDLDYTWMCSKKGFEHIRDHLGKSKEEMIVFLEKNEKNDRFYSDVVKRLHDRLMDERRLEITTS